jgi:phosphate transport system protein
MKDKHLSTQFDEELEVVSARVLEMGGLAESQVTKAFSALINFRAHEAVLVLERQERMRAMQVDIDRDLSGIIARRQPAARDLRSLIGFSKTVANLERIGDEAIRIARTVQHFVDSGVSTSMQLPLADIDFIGKLAMSQLRDALDSFSRLDAAGALEQLKTNKIALEFDGLMRKLTTHMMEDPRTTAAVVDLVLAANALERVGAHARNLYEQIVYIVDGTGGSQSAE